MDARGKYSSVPRTNPENNAGFFSKGLYLWLIGILKKSNKEGFEEKDIPEVLALNKSELLANGLQKKWEKEIETAQKKKKTPNFLHALIAEFGLEFTIMALGYLVKDFVSVIVSPYLLGRLLVYFAPNSTMSSHDALVLAVTLSVLGFVTGLSHIHFQTYSQRFAVRVRAACIATVYRKVLRLSQSALAEVSSGLIINLVSNDVARFEWVIFLLMPLASAPITSAVLFVFLYQMAGPASLIGVGVLFLILVIQTWNAKWTASYRMKIAKKIDGRVRLIDEIVQGIQVIKMYAWEKPFQDFVETARRTELRVLRKTSFLRAIFMFFILFTPRAAVFCTVLFMFLWNITIETSSIFVMTVYFSQLSTSMVLYMIRGFAEITEILVSIGRIQEFLLRDEQQAVNVEGGGGSGRGSEEAENSAVVMSQVSAKWTHNGNECLHGLELNVRRGQLVAVIGIVGCGKSSLLNLLLGELVKTKGDLKIGGVVSFAAQEPWIFSSTVRQNIVFREDFNATRYKTVCRVCQLERDFELLPRGDKTLVGEKGASLSGGQKARINLARAIYKKADIYLLDDPLSAVDTHVGKHLFQHCIEEFLGNKTRILVTHQVQFLNRVDHLVLMENGEIQTQGTYEELKHSEFNFATVLKTPDKEKSSFTFSKPAVVNRKHRESTGSEKSNSTIPDGPAELTTQLSRFQSQQSITSTVGGEFVEIEEFENNRQAEQTTQMPSMQVYCNYLKAGVGPFYCLCALILFVSTQIFVSGFDYWLAHWLHMEEERVNVPQGTLIWPTSTYLYILGAILAGLFVVGNARGFTYYEGCIRCSRGIHRQMFRAIISTPISFFHNNPSGRILNRFSKDIAGTDELFAKFCMDLCQFFGQVIGCLVITISVSYGLSIPVLLLIIILLSVRQVCLQASKNLKRVEGIVRSPVYAHINASLHGLVTIRAHQAENLLHTELSNYLDMHTTVTHLFYSVMGFLAVAQEILSNTFITICIMSYTLLKSESSADTTAGLIITQCLTVMQFMHWGVKVSTDVANQLTCVERALEYTQLPAEQTNTEKLVEPEKKWPQYGRIEMKNIYLRYETSEPYVLRNLNFTVKPLEKVGIVGRTGAGKSSLIAALFRLTPVEGSVYLDAVDTASVSLECLRSRISIIPQDPILFSGTVRKNLDPFGKYSDAELNNALREVNLTEKRSNGEDVHNVQDIHLDSAVTEGGGNFSVGQRQLVCLARAILRDNKVLVLDEATANVDPQTDQLIQKTIRRLFANCTVLTVAHRLNTIIDCDRVLVMDAGSVAEFDHPHNLLSNKDGLFYGLVQQTGQTNANELTTIAQQNFQGQLTTKSAS